MSIQRVAAVGSIVAVVVAIVAALMLIGSPAEQRLRRLDEGRVNDLRALSRAVYFQWNERQVLAASAADLVDGRSLTRLPVDRSSDEPYEYRVTGPRAFELCAVFARPSRPQDAHDFWYHDAGRRCFEFDVTENPRF
jgi:hypothetical protein